MIYRNDNIEITDEYVKGSVEDIMEYFRYEIAHQSMSYGVENEIENYIDNVRNMIDTIENLQEDLMNNIYTKDDIVKVSEHSMGGFVIERGDE